MLTLPTKALGDIGVDRVRLCSVVYFNLPSLLLYVNITLKCPPIYVNITESLPFNCYLLRL